MNRISQLLNRTRLLILLGFIFLQPVFIFFNLFDMFVLPRLILARLVALALIILTGIMLLQDQKYLFSQNRFRYPVLALFFMVALTSLSSIHLRTGLYGLKTRYEGLYTWLTYAALFFLASDILDDIKKRKYALFVLLASSWPVSVYGIAQYFGLDPLKDYVLYFAPGRASSFFGSPLVTGMFLVFPVIFGLFVSLDSHEFRVKTAGFATAAVSGLCLILTYTRSAWLGLLAGILYLFVTGKEKRKYILGVIAFVIIVAALLFSRGGYFQQRLDEPVSKRGYPDRYYIYSATLKLINDNPLGIGQDTFPYVFPKYKRHDWSRVISEKWRQTDKAHSDILQVSSALGFIGTLFYLWLLILLMRPPESKGRYTIASAAACFAYLTGVQLSFTEPSVTPLFWVFLGAAGSSAGRYFEFKKRLFPATIIPFLQVFLCLAILPGLITGYRALLADNRIMWSNFYLDSKYPPELSIRESLQAVKADPYEDMYWRVLANGYLNYALLNNDENYYNEAVKAMDRALGINPYNPLNLLAAGDILWRGGTVFRGRDEAGQAERYYRRALEIEPDILNARLGLIELYSDLGKYRSARRELKYILEADPSHTDLERKLEETERKIRDGI